MFVLIDGLEMKEEAFSCCCEKGMEMSVAEPESCLVGFRREELSRVSYVSIEDPADKKFRVAESSASLFLSFFFSQILI